jgi:hypothetical protein
LCGAKVQRKFFEIAIIATLATPALAQDLSRWSVSAPSASYLLRLSTKISWWRGLSESGRVARRIALVRFAL